MPCSVASWNATAHTHAHTCALPIPWRLQHPLRFRHAMPVPQPRRNRVLARIVQLEQRTATMVCEGDTRTRMRIMRLHTRRPQRKVSKRTAAQLQRKQGTSLPRESHRNHRCTVQRHVLLNTKQGHTGSQTTTLAQQPWVHGSGETTGKNRPQHRSGETPRGFLRG